MDLGLPEFPWEVERAVPETEEGKQEGADGWNYSVWGVIWWMMRHRRLWAIAMSAFEVAYTALALIENWNRRGSMKIKAMPIQDWNDCELVLGEVREIELKADACRTSAQGRPENQRGTDRRPGRDRGRPRRNGTGH
ncbi:MAG: hypothetical protein MZV65_38360 [Chromatiales bacterium]|nr:hypothetical protein [Chromatiales bacterium]